MKTAIRFLATALSVLLLVLTFLTVDKAVANTTSSLQALSMETEALGTFRYWLYTPSDPTDDMPLIVYLHGGSGKGDDLNLITAVDGFPKYLQDGTLGDIPAYVIIPQLPSSKKGWTDVGADLMSLIRYIRNTYNVSSSRVSLTGHSMGGTGTWGVAAAYPASFSKIAPCSGSINNTTINVNKLKGIPVRAFVGSADTIVSPDSSINFVAALKQAGGDAEVTVFDGAGHFDVPALVYLDESIAIIDWLLSEPCAHGETEIRNAKEATCCEDGYTGDTYCFDCGEIIAEGTVIPASGHAWGEWTVTVPATVGLNGMETRVCCNDSHHIETRRYSFLNFTPISDFTYRFVRGNIHITAYNGSDTEVYIPESYIIDGRERIVAAIEESAFEANKTLERISLPSTIESIGAYAFYDCTALFDVALWCKNVEIGEKALGYYYVSPKIDGKVDGFGVTTYSYGSAHSYLLENDLYFTRQSQPVGVGDFDANGEYNSVDIIMMRNQLLSYEEPEGRDLIVADLNDDESVNILDLICLKKKIANLQNNQ